MKYVEFGNNNDGIYFTKFVEEEIAEKRRQEEEPEEGVAKSHDETGFIQQSTE